MAGLTMPVVGPAGARSDAPAGVEALPRRVVSHASGGRDLWSAPLPRAPEDPPAAALDCLREVLDPEIPISLVDLGLIYGVEVSDTAVRVRLTYTATGCPCMSFIREDIRDRLLREPWISAVELDEVWDPPWTRDRITPRGRALLRQLGVAS